MEKNFTHKIYFHELNKTFEEDMLVCLGVITLVNNEINLYGIVKDFKVYHKNKNYEFHFTLYDHHGDNAEYYVRGLINGILIEKGMLINHDKANS